MNICLLCLEFKDELMSHGIKVTSKQWREENMEQLIEKHLWWPLKSITSTSCICLTCWQALQDFHKFYIRIEDAHAYCVSMLKTELLESNEYVNSTATSLPTNSQDIEYEKEPTINLDEEEKPIIIKTEHINEEQLIPDDVEFPKKTRYKHRDPLEKPLPARNRKGRKLKKSEKLEESCDEIQEDCKPDIKQDDNEDNQNISENHNSPINDDDNFRGSSDSNNESDNDESPAGGDWKPRANSYYKPRTNRNELNEFLAKHFNISCVICQAPMKTFHELCKHFAKCHNERGYVICCNKKFLKCSILVDHIHCHLNPEHFKCKTCGKILSDRRCLETHVKKHETQDKTHICDICGKGFSLRNGLRQHKLVHLSYEERKFPCEECGKLFGNNNLLSNHVRVVHLNKYALVCDICGKKMRNKDVFERHMLEHNGVILPTISCDVCGLKVTNQRGLKRHKDTQHPEGGKKDYPCQICAIVSPTLKAHRKHVQYKHEMGYNFKCTVCDKTFKRSTSLTEHMATHTGTVLYTCPYCPKTFNSNGNMHSHRKKAHPKEWEEAVRAKYSGNLPPNYKTTATNEEQNTDTLKWQ